MTDKQPRELTDKEKQALKEAEKNGPAIHTLAGFASMVTKPVQKKEEKKQ